ncbi:asparagine--tRNA ligase [Patescibacteria group bacterium]|nr:asparagine--tRNA ligase [Patescibacteria group bacterium]MBU1890949.1 asparagine--tRNA ligase [Patescibacteria group bacterium]
MINIVISDIPKYLKKEVLLKGWVFNVRSSGSVFFLQFRDGSGRLQAIVSKKEVPAQIWEACEKLTGESSVELSGTVKEEPRSPYGYEMAVKSLKIIHIADSYPISKKEHGTEFLMDNRHLWLRSPRQIAILKVRDEVIWQMRKFFKDKGFILTDSPILTPTSCEGTTTLFKTDYFDTQAYLAQTGQLYIEATAAALGRVYDFGPTFRAEKSKTRRHLTEFWMLDAEAAFVEFEENLNIQEELVSYVVQNVLIEKKDELELLERDTAILKKVKPPFHRMKYSEAVTKLQKAGYEISENDDLGGDEETALSKDLDKPVFITHYPSKIKSFYMKPDPENPNLVLNNDMIAPEGYGELVGGSQRIDDLATLEKKLKEFKLPRKDFEWYLDLRRYGSFPHSGFGIGLERTVGWICGVKHVRETIPFPRLINRLNP